MTDEAFEDSLRDTQFHCSLVPDSQLALTYPQEAELKPTPPRMRGSLLVDDRDMVAASLSANKKPMKVKKAQTTGGLAKLRDNQMFVP